MVIVGAATPERSRPIAAYACAATGLAAVIVEALLWQFPQVATLPPSTSLLSFHLLLELFAVIITALIVTVSWHTLGTQPGGPANLWICSFTCVGLLDLVHALSYQGMPDFLGVGSVERAIFYWLMSRTVEAVTLVLIALGLVPRLSRGTALAIGLAITGALVGYGSHGVPGFPATYVQGVGLTAFKVDYELALCAANILAAGLLWRRALQSGQSRFYLLATAAWVIGVGELSFANWKNISDAQNVFGHGFKIVAYALFYGSTYISSLRAPLQSERRARSRADEHEAILTATIESASDAVINIDIDGRIILFNPAAERIFGRPASSMVGQALDVLLPGAARARHSVDIAKFAQSGVTRRRMGPGRVKGIRSDGGELELEASISQTVVGGRPVMTAILRNVTDRVRTERALIQYQTELTELNHALLTQERELTQRIAQVLHDELGQTLAAMRIDFVTEEQFESKALEKRHARVGVLIDQAVREVRQVLADLRPMVLEENGLAHALEFDIEQRRQRAGGIEIQVEIDGALAEQRWGPDLEYATFMIAREAVSNALRHARARTIYVRLLGDERHLTLEVADDGEGIAGDPHAARPGHLGMVGMRERALAVGAHFEVHSTPGGGTSVCLSWEESTS
jgi:PAS domain S-box-containing protein